MTVRINPSILTADFANLQSEVERVFNADALHVDNLGPWLSDEDGRGLLCELVKQGSLGFADE